MSKRPNSFPSHFGNIIIIFENFHWSQRYKTVAKKNIVFRPSESICQMVELAMCKRKEPILPRVHTSICLSANQFELLGKYHATE